MGFVEDQAEQTFLVAQAFEHVAVVIEQVVAVLLEQRGPIVLRRHRTWLIVRRLRALVSHPPLSPLPLGEGEGEGGKLLHVIAVAHPIVPEYVTVGTEFGYDCGRSH